MALSSLLARRPDPFDFFANLFDPFDWGPLDPSLSYARDQSAANNTRVDWVESPECHTFRAELPGVSKDDVKVEVEDGNVLKISGQRGREQTDDNDRWHHVERTFGQFLRRFRLPDNVDTERVEANMENGVLNVKVPKKEEKQAECRPISIDWKGNVDAGSAPRIEEQHPTESAPASQEASQAAGPEVTET